jgi:hypothetical protein
MRKCCRFRGGAAETTLLTVVAFATLAVAAVVLGPRVIRAEAQAVPAATPARTSDHQQFLDLLAGIVVRSRAVLAVHDRGATPFEEIVLWIEDPDRPEQVDAAEIALISHSRILHTVVFRRLRAGQPGHGLFAYDWNDPAFCEAWRTSPEVKGTVVAAGISDLDFAWAPLFQEEADALRITFTWSSDSSDTSDVASTVVGVVDQSRKMDRAGVP